MASQSCDNAFVHDKLRAVFLVVGGLLGLLLLGVFITRITVHDLVEVSPALRQCALAGVKISLNNTIERIALALGESRVIQVDGPNEVGVESFTIFHIPLMWLRGMPGDARMGVTCDFPASTNAYQYTVDGINVQGLGQFHDSLIEDGVKTYGSEKFGISFSYPEQYLLFETKGEGAEGREYYVITLISDSPFIRDLMKGVHYDTEGPPSIHFSFYRERNRSVSLEKWVRANVQSQFDPSDPAQGAVLTPTSVAGVPALAYHYEGLYQADAVAFAYGEWVVIAAVDSLSPDGDPKQADFRSILASLSVKR